MKIQLFRPQISEEAIRAVADVLRSGWLGSGPRTEVFEEAFAAYTGAPYCVALNSCTAAIHLALRLLDLPRKSEVITTALTFVATNHAILYEGLKPVFADIEPETGNLSVAAVADRITDRTRAIMLVHYGGYPCDLDEFYALAGDRGIHIIEDCAHACGATYKGRRVGSHGDLHAFSFQAVKNLPMGDGGALTVRSKEHYERLRRLRWLGIDKDTFKRTTEDAPHWEYDVTEVGFKYHMNDIQGAIGLEQLRILDEGNARRAAIAGHYRKALSKTPGVQLTRTESDRTSSFHLCPILVENRDGLVAKLCQAEIEVGVHYKRNDEYRMYERQDLPHTEYFWRSVVSLPMHLQLTDEQVSYVTDTIASGW
jgi:Predicted pyridoxal phosphate-dependent enzyme apparently involved in regulation of cell wall biogenesis